ncbi:MAG: hypothetical protein MUF24_00075 [Chitinophagaceae bacterium]|jgi:hypothetical protein|nr:hypothetical protein [Chitinophagaceae bacterium]
MQRTDLIQEIKQLPLSEKFWVVEEVLKIIKNEELHQQMEHAAEQLFVDYSHDKDLTAFSSLDFEQFYETR